MIIARKQLLLKKYTLDEILLSTTKPNDDMLKRKQHGRNYGQNSRHIRF